MNTAREQSAYQRLAAHMDDAPLGAPNGPELEAILAELFSPQEAEIAARLPFRPTPLARLAEELDMEAEALEAHLADMARRGLVFQGRGSKGLRYSLLPIVPGMLELQFMGGEVSPRLRHLAKLFEAYYRPGIGRALVEAGKAGTPYSRVIPVGRVVENRQEILPHEQAAKVVEAQEFLALTTCYCRHEAELLDKACGAPKDVCLIFGPFARYVVDRGLAREIDRAEAREVLERAEEAGLIHVSDNVAAGANFICNCCGCCCLFLKTVTALDAPGSVAPAAWLAVVDAAECTACGACADACQVGAVTQQDEDPAQVDPERCLGCGHCATACAFEAITMERRPKPPAPAANWPELTTRLLGQRKKSA
jgi:Fe-S-cluster-containing hydrogenase component 2